MSSEQDTSADCFSFPTLKSAFRKTLGTSLVVQWLRLHTSIAGDVGWGTKILYAVRCSKKMKQKKKDSPLCILFHLRSQNSRVILNKSFLAGVLLCCVVLLGRVEQNRLMDKATCKAPCVSLASHVLSMETCLGTLF